MKRSYWAVMAAALLSLALVASFATAAEKKDAKTVSGKSSCATCSGVTEAGHQIMLVDKDGMRWVLIGNSDSYKKAHEVRDDGKKMIATLAGDPVKKKDATGKAYMEVKVSDVKVEA